MIQILITLKFILFTYLTKVEFNKIPVIITSSLIAVLVLSLIQDSKIKHKNIISLIFYSLVSILMLIDSTYFSQFNYLTSVSVLKQVSQLKTVGDSIKLLLNIKILLLVIDIPFLIICNKKLLKFKEKTKNQTLIITLILLTTLFYFKTTNKLESIVSQELFTYHILDIQKSIVKQDNIAEAIDLFTEEDIEELKSRAQFDGGKHNAIGKGKNLIVLQVEALQNFVIGLEYDGQAVTPNINKLIQDTSSLYYDNYYQLLGRGNTSDAEFVSQNSLYPSMEEPTYIQYANNTFYGLPWLLRDNNYTSWVFHGYEKTFWNREVAYVNQGFQRFISQEDFIYDNSIGFGLKDEDFFNQSMEYLKELDQIDDDPFYAFMITLTSHTPFIMPEEYQTLSIKEEHKNTLLDGYLQSIHYADQEIGKFIQRLKEEGLYEDTVIALYGDHFAVLSTQEQEQKLMTKFLGENYDFDNMMNVPLVIHVPGTDINETITTTGSQLDFYPTIANIMGYKNYKGLVFGRDLTNYTEKNYVFPQTYMLKGSVIDDKSTFVISRDGVYDHSRAYDIETKEKLDIDNFREISQKAIEEINKSNEILKTNILKDIVQNTLALTEKNKYLVAHAGGEIDGQSYTNSKAALDLSYKKGIRMLEVDFEWTTDGKLVCVHSWDGFINKFFNVEAKQYSYEEFESFTMINGWTQLTPESLATWLEEHPDAYLVTDIKRDNIKGLTILVQSYPNLIDRIIPQIYKLDEYETTKELGYENIILTLYLMGDKEQILEFEHLNKLFAVTMPESSANTDLPKKLSDQGIYVYTHTINDKEKLATLKQNGVKGFYTDNIEPN